MADPTHSGAIAPAVPALISNSETDGEAPLIRGHMPELDSVRGVAVLMVIFYHAFYWGMDLTRFPAVERHLLQVAWIGKLGVNLFFVLSGFLITGLLLNARSQPDYYRKFYIRRALRILPAYSATVLVLVATGVSLKFIGLSVLYLSNLTPLFGVAIAYPVLWSLAVEEHFYFLWPMVVRNLSNRAVLAASAGMILASPLLRWITYQIESSRHGWVSFGIFDYTWNSLDGLACGAFLAVWLREFAPDRKQFGRKLAGLLAVGMVLLPFGILSRHTAEGAAMQVVPWHFLFVVVIGAAILAGSRWGAAARSRLLEFFGEISYGLYLYHLLVFRGFEWLLDKRIIRRAQIDPLLGLSIRLLVCGGIAVGIAYLSRRYFEEPFLKLKSRLAP